MTDIVPSPLDRIRVVLVRPSHPGNIGATARAMKNMGLGTLHLVLPKSFPDLEAAARAADAVDILDSARVCNSLEAAVGDCRLVIGTSARHRRVEWPVLTPRLGARELVAEAEHGPVALIFGHERTGLTNDEMKWCRSVVSIPTSSEYASLNLASAVQILAYEIFLAAANLAQPPAAEPEREESRTKDAPVTALEMRRFFEHLEETMVQTGFLDPARPRLLMRRLMRLFERARPDRNELNILRGILTSVQQRNRPRRND